MIIRRTDSSEINVAHCSREQPSQVGGRVTSDQNSPHHHHHHLWPDFDIADHDPLTVFTNIIYIFK